MVFMFKHNRENVEELDEVDQGMTYTKYFRRGGVLRTSKL